MSEPRSWLFVPADSERKIAKALTSAADAIILDLEDSVASGQKPAAREIVTETAASLFGLATYRLPGIPLAAMSWGAEDLSAALGAASKYDADGTLSFTYRMARSLTLAGAVAAGVQPVDGVFADFRDPDGLRAEAEAAAREGFTGKLAIHPDQVAIINAAFSPSPDDIAHAEAIVTAFEAQPDAGVLSVGGRMVDRPHLVQARRVLERAASGGNHGNDA